MGFVRIVLVGPAAQLRRLRHQLPDGVDIIGEAPTMGAARLVAGDPDAFLVAGSGGREEERLVEALTPRESQVLHLLADGLPNKAIAARLGIGDETVKFHLAAVFGKLGATNRTDAVRQAIRRGLVAI
jgi:DNA-binding NarL/FixJ family response regulator